eukprot:281907-Alexandrium_andersonii.AAC.1
MQSYSPGAMQPRRREGCNNHKTNAQSSTAGTTQCLLHPLVLQSKAAYLGAEGRGQDWERVGREWPVPQSVVELVNSPDENCAP